MKPISTFDWICIFLIVLGGLNWGLIGLFRYDLIAQLLGTMSYFSRAAYAAIGFAGIYMLLIAPTFSKRP